MDLERMLAQLRRERDAIDVAILNLELLTRAGKPRLNRSTECSTNSHTNGPNGSYKNLPPEESI
jgi:hypothetical protein